MEELTGKVEEDMMKDNDIAGDNAQKSNEKSQKTVSASSSVSNTIPGIIILLQNNSLLQS